MVRTQILLDPDQHKALLEIAGTEKRSLSDLVRRKIQAQMEVRRKENLVKAAKELLSDYQIDPELTSFSTLDGDDFHA